MSKTTVASLRRILKLRRSKGEKWRSIGLDYPGVKLGTLARIAYDENYDPKSPAIRAALGLPPRTVSVEPLACGHAPLSKRCPICRPRSTTPNAQRKRDRRIEAMRSGVKLNQLLESMSG